VDREQAVTVLERLHAAQRSFYGGGGDKPLRAVLTDDIAWHIPGHNDIAGEYRGIEAVMDYFARRRDLARRTFRMYPGEVLVGDGDHVAVLTDGAAQIDGVERRWSTVGLYRLRGERVAECRLLPFDARTFDEIWTTARQR
jgi:ketosteroid isomerase-like protein